MKALKMNKLLIVLAALILLSICSAYAATSFGSHTPADLYNAAMQQLVDGHYADAAQSLDRIHGYSDAAEMAVYCRAMDAASRGDYETAVNGLALLDGFKDTELLIDYYKACSYQALAASTYQADATGEESDWIIEAYEDAADLFARLPLYKDSDARRVACENQAGVVRAEQVERENQAVYSAARVYDDAAHAVDLATAEDSSLETAYNNCSAAIRRYRTITGYSDADDRISACMALQTQLNDEYIRRQNQRAYDVARTYDNAAHTVDPVVAVDETIRTAINDCQQAVKRYGKISTFSDSADRIAACKTLQATLEAELDRRTNQRAYDAARAYDDAAHAVDFTTADDAALKSASTSASTAARAYQSLLTFGDSQERQNACLALVSSISAELERRTNQRAYDAARAYDDAAHAVDLATADDAALRSASTSAGTAARAYQSLLTFGDSQERQNACLALVSSISAELERRTNQRAYDAARAYDDAAHAVDFTTADDAALRSASTSASTAARAYQSLLTFGDSQERQNACLALVSSIAAELDRRTNQRAYDAARAYDDAAHAVDLATADDAALRSASTSAGTAARAYQSLLTFGDSQERQNACLALVSSISAELERRANQLAYDTARAYDDAAHQVDLTSASTNELKRAINSAEAAIKGYKAIAGFSDSAERSAACQELITAIDSENTRRSNQRVYDSVRAQDDAAHALSLTAATDAELASAMTSVTNAITQYQALGSFSDAPARAAACQLLKTSLADEILRREKQAIYDAGMTQETTATTLFNEGCSYATLLQVIDSCDKAILQYQSISGFSDADARIEACTSLRVSAQNLLDPTRYAETGVLESAAFAVDMNTATLGAMNQAVTDLDAAIQAYTELNGYADSKQRISDCTARQQQLKTVITRQKNYEVGLGHEKKALALNVNTAPLADLRTIVSSCEDAINSFMELGGYRDSMQHLTSCQELQQKANRRIQEHKLYGSSYFSYTGSGVIRVLKSSSSYDNYTLLDLTGKTIASGYWKYISDFSEGFASYYRSRNSYTYINTQGQTLGSKTWYSTSPFSEGFAAVKTYSSKYSYIDKTGAEKLTGNWYYAGPFKEGLAVVKNAAGNYGFINTSGAMILTARWAEAKDFSDGLAAVKHNGKWGFIDKQDQQVVACVWEDVRSFSEGLAAVKHNGKWGFIDKTGTMVIPCSFSYVEDFHEGRAIVREGNYSSSRYGFIDKTGKLVINYKYYEAFSFSNGLARVRESSSSYSGYYGFIDVNGNRVIPMTYAAASDFHDGYAVVVDNNSYMSIIDTAGKPVY